MQPSPRCPSPLGPGVAEACSAQTPSSRVTGPCRAASGSANNRGRGCLGAGTTTATALLAREQAPTGSPSPGDEPAQHSGRARAHTHVGLFQHVLQLVGLGPCERGAHVTQVDGVVHHTLACLHHLQHRLSAGTEQPCLGALSPRPHSLASFARVLQSGQGAGTMHTDLYRGFRAMISRMVFTISAVRAWQAGTRAVTGQQKWTPQDHPQDPRAEPKSSPAKTQDNMSENGSEHKALAAKPDGLTAPPPTPLHPAG